MSVAPVSLASGTLAAGAAVLMMAPLASIAAITAAVFSNTGANPETIQVNVVRSGGGAGTGNIVIPGQVIPPKGTFVAPELVNLVLNAGDALYGFAGDAATVNFILSGWTAT